MIRKVTDTFFEVGGKSVDTVELSHEFSGERNHLPAQHVAMLKGELFLLDLKTGEERDDPAVERQVLADLEFLRQVRAQKFLEQAATRSQHLG